ncbi:MAG TPA: hypothetical protein VI759_09400, partial [Dehalococcoidia bacterium]|nr:hypothetical protein [Dehalococcoidia bacterium]
MTAGVLHADLIALADQSDAARERLIEAAARVAEIEHVLAAGAIEADAGSEFDVVLFFALADLAALEAFGTDERYTRFLQQDVAANLRAFAGADVSIDAGL